MLIENNMRPKEGDVIAFRLVSGEEVIGRLAVESVTTITITRPVVVQMQMVAPGQAGLAFAPFMVGADEDVRLTFELDKLITKPVKARKDISDNYLRATTKLAVPTNLG